jgi:hypothetical protein
MAAATVRGPTSSTFPALLKRSKFATYDPAISQIYTAPSADAHRGNWGLKRPLALKRRRAFITVKSIDTLEKQTDWDPANHEALFLKKWAEVGKVDGVRTASQWAEQLPVTNRYRWSMDSEFALGQEDGSEWIKATHEERARRKEAYEKGEKSVKWSLPASSGTASAPELQGHVPNIEAMKPDEFQAYLEEVRGMRQEFMQFLKYEESRVRDEQKRTEEKALSNKAGTTSVSRRSWRQTATSDPLAQYVRDADVYKRFLRYRAIAHSLKIASKKLERIPHPNGGLSYAKVPELQHHFMSQPQMGRALQGMAQTREANHYITSFAGMTPLLNRRVYGNQSNVDFGTDKTPRRDANAGILQLRLQAAELVRAPTVVGRHTTGLSGATILSSVAPAGREDTNRPVAGIPGSRDYVGALTPVDRSLGVQPMKSGLAANAPRVPKASDRYFQKGTNEGTLKLLRDIKKSLPSQDPLDDF